MSCLFIMIYLQETPRPSNMINLIETQDYSIVTIPEGNQRLVKVSERGRSTYVPSMGNIEIFRNQHEMNHPIIQNRVLPW